MTERQLDDLLDALSVKYHKSPIDDGVNYEIAVRPGVTFQLNLQLYVDQLNISFNGCYVALEQAAYEWRFRRNPAAKSQWRDECISYVRSIMTSDLKVETRWLFNSLLGGYLYRWNGKNWQFRGGGGSLFLFLGKREVSEYHSWLA